MHFWIEILSQWEPDFYFYRQFYITLNLLQEKGGTIVTH